MSILDNTASRFSTDFDLDKVIFSSFLQLFNVLYADHLLSIR